MRVLMSAVLADPNTQQHGRQGQPQCGIDVYGYRDRSISRLVGVQCKQKLNAPVTEKELRAEVRKAKKFRPAISEFILATTASRDQAIQGVARAITSELAATNDPFTVTVWGWEDIEHYVSQHAEAYKAFDPTWNPLLEVGFARIEQTLQQFIDQQSRPVASSSLQPSSVAADQDSDNTPRQGQITVYIKLIEDGYIELATTQLERLKATEWQAASSSERYRLTVAFAAAKLKNGAPEDAGRLLLEAFEVWPAHKRAKQNLAKGHLLLGDYARAGHLASEVLQADHANSDAASILIQARSHDAGCQSPFRDIPPALLDAEDVRIARIHVLRRNSDDAWLSLARESARQYPESRQLRLMAAEAVLEELTRVDRDVIVGAPVTSVTHEELSSSVTVLRDEAEDAITKRYRLMPSVASNAALALRYIDDLPAATRILDEAIRQHPDDGNLRLQRALLAFAQSDMRKVLEMTEEHDSDLEAAPLRATALADTGRPDDALNLIDCLDTRNAPDHVKLGLLSARCHAYLARNESALAVQTARQAAMVDPPNANVAAVLIRTYYLAGENDAASKALDDAMKQVSATTSLSTCLLLSFEAQRLDRNDAIVSLLKGRIDTSHDNEALRLLVASAINGQLWVTAQETLNAIPDAIRDQEWVQRALTILALNTGDREADQIVGAYLKRWPNDASMVLARIGAWQRVGRINDIRSFLNNLHFEALRGPPGTTIRIAAIACYYGDAGRALVFAYSALMNNWNDAKAHLSYQALLLLNEHIAPTLVPSNVVGEDTVVFIAGENTQRRYRIETRSHTFFEDERLDPRSDLARILLGKKVGDTFFLQDRIGATSVTIKEIKSVAVDALHRSLDEFNERFPLDTGLMTVKFDVSSDDPLEDMRAITKHRAESDRRILDQYRSTGLPLAFVSGLLGRDPLQAWAGLSSVNVPFLVCRGNAQERGQAIQLLITRSRAGCVLDAITLSIIRRLGVADAVRAVCGPLHTPQAVLDLLASRALQARMNVGRTAGFLSWREGQLVMENVRQEMLEQVANECEVERDWALQNVAVVTAMPKRDFSSETRMILQAMHHAAGDPAVSAEGSSLLLLSDDLGLRQWAELTFDIKTTWLQPVLMVARHDGVITPEAYFDATCKLLLSGHTYISLEADALMRQARKDSFELTVELQRLVDAIGGSTADLSTNCGVAAAFLDLVIQECSDELKTMRICSRILESMVRGREYQQRSIVPLITQRLTSKPHWFYEHILEWLIGHSIGTPDFAELLSMQKQRTRR
jgi:tetratricopeptide (TPR) repeat protein